jgi:TP901 family phage tail tape measure protein
MAVRTVSVKLVAEVANYIQGTRQAAAATKDLGSQITREAQANRQAWAEVGRGLLAFGATVGVGLGIAVKRFADFDQAMSAVQAATHETTANMKLLRQAALDAGARTAFSATQAAEGIEALAKAGISTTAILRGGLAGALDLAAAGGLDVGDAAEIAATAMTLFRLSGEKVPHVADLLAAAAGKARGNVSDMGMALNQAGLVASQTGLTIEETTAGLAAFASAGLLGSDAGTSFKAMLQRLTPQSVEAADLMDELGISAYDAQGNFIGLEAFAGNLQQSLSGLTVEQRNSAMATIFGSDAVRAASVLYRQGSAGIADWTAKVNDQGFAAETAAIRLDNLKGDVEALGGSLETALIGSASGANGVLREITQTATAAINVFGALPAPVQSAAFGIGVVAAAVSLAGGAFLIAVPKVVAFRTAVGSMGPTTQRVAGGIGAMAGALAGPLGLALTAGTVALGLYGMKRAEAQAAVEEFTAAIQQDSGAVGENARALAANRLEANGVYEQAQKLGIGLDLVTEAALGNTDALEEIESQMRDGNIIVGQDFYDKINDVADATRKGTEAADRQKQALGEEAGAAEDGAGAQAELELAMQEATGAAFDQTEALGDLMEQVRSLSDQVLGLRGSEREFEAAIDDATAAVAENGRTLDVTTEKGRANEAALDGIASSANDVLTAMVESGAPLDAVTAKMGQQREALVRAAIGFGMTEEAANTYADSVLRVPTRTETRAAFDGYAASQAIAQHMAALGRIPRSVSTQVIISEIRRDAAAAARGPIRRASGGWISGPGTSTSDSIPAWLSRGEFVVNARSAAQNALLLEAINASRGFAAGGWVSGRSGGSSGGAVSKVEKHYHVNAPGLYAEPVTNERLGVVLRRMELLSGG